jgi:hypothetical protein
MQRVMDYCMQEKKTWDEESGIHFVTGINCDGLNSVTEFETTKAAWNKDDGIRFYQYVQSFSPEENITHKQAHEIALAFAAKAWPGYEVLVATHCDTDHIHSHFVINSVSFENGLKLRQHPDTLLHLRKLNDEICEAYGFSTLKPYEKGGTKISAREYRAAVGGESWKFQLMYHIGEAMKRSPTKADFIREMKQRNYDVTWTEDRKYITYTCPNGKKCRGIKLHEEKYKKEMMEYEFAIRKQESDRLIAVATGAAQRSELGNQGENPLSAHGVCHSGGVAQEGGTTTGGCGAVPANAVQADRAVGHILGHCGDAEHGAAEDQSATHQHGGKSGTPPTTGWEDEREILFGLIQEALRRPTGPTQHQGRPGKDLPQMGAHRGGSFDSVFSAGLYTLSAIGAMTDNTTGDEDERRRRIEGKEIGAAIGTTLGLAIGALLAIRDAEYRREEAAVQESFENEQKDIWQLSM